MNHRCRLFIFVAGVIALLAACVPGEETVETDTLITRAEVFNEKGERVAYSDFAYDGRCRLVSESHYTGAGQTKVALEYDEKGRLKTRMDDALGPRPVRLDYTYADDGKTVNVRQTSEGQPAGEMNNIFENGVLVGRNWGESRPNAAVFKLETTADKIVRRTYLTGGKLRSTEILTFDAGRLTAFEYHAQESTETRRYEYDGKKLLKESVFDDRGNVTSVIKFSYSSVKVLKAYAGVYNYLHVGNLIAEVKGNGAK